MYPLHPTAGVLGSHSIHSALTACWERPAPLPALHPEPTVPASFFPTSGQHFLFWASTFRREVRLWVKSCIVPWVAVPGGWLPSALCPIINVNVQVPIMLFYKNLILQLFFHCIWPSTCRRQPLICTAGAASEIHSLVSTAGGSPDPSCKSQHGTSLVSSASRAPISCGIWTWQ